MSEHTPGKLGIDAHNNIVASGGRLVAFPCISAGFDQKANANRLVACWNACDGISTESLVGGTALITVFQREQDRADTAERQRDSLRAVNAKLLGALTNLMRNFPTDHDMKEAGWDGVDIEKACTAHDKARAAIASARKQGEQG
jgi:hypothetical protein